MGSRADVPQHRAVHDRGSLRGRRRDRAGESPRSRRRARRPALPGRVPRTDGERIRRLRVRRCRRCNRRQDDSPSPARLRRCGCLGRDRTVDAVGGDEGRGTIAGRRWEESSRRHPPRAAGAGSCLQAAASCREVRVRLAERGRGIREGVGRARRAEGGGAQPRPGGGRRGGRRPAVYRRQPRTPSRHGPRNRRTPPQTGSSSGAFASSSVGPAPVAPRSMRSIRKSWRKSGRRSRPTRNRHPRRRHAAPASGVGGAGACGHADRQLNCGPSRLPCPAR